MAADKVWNYFLVKKKQERKGAQNKPSVLAFGGAVILLRAIWCTLLNGKKQ